MCSTCMGNSSNQGKFYDYSIVPLQVTVYPVSNLSLSKMCSSMSSFISPVAIYISAILSLANTWVSFDLPRYLFTFKVQIFLSPFYRPEN